ncbi:carboxypeptidase-like regulatory domain-containing protein [Ancylomarina sp.]|uniref:carboxypeptidase-like regulatory domain-containing protein n=1 Tax=Ancylomarina sp. TaxID=1970196 RepID=UPI003567E829
MEVLLEILIRASISIAVFYALYWLLLRQSTHFTANRLFLLISLLISVVLAVVPVQYQVLIPAPSSPALSDYSGVFNRDVANTSTNGQNSNGMGLFGVLLIIYSIGAAIVLLRLLIQCRKPLLIITKSKPKKIYDCLIHENKVFNSPFSFFNRILINPEYFQQDEIVDILTHEKVHIQERHWIDLFIIELLTVFFWFNPFIWFFERAIKRNHEYLADEGVLSRGHSPVRYQALLINRLMGTQVIGLANHFNSSLGLTRFKMMTKEKTAKRKLFRMIWGVPVLALLLMAFAKPEYKVKADKEIQIAVNDIKLSAKDTPVKVKGTVKDDKGNPMPGASVILRGTTTGTVADRDGNYKIELPNEGKFVLIVSYVGYKSVVNTISMKSTAPTKWKHDFMMEREVISIDSKDLMNAGDVPPPPPPAPEFDKNSDKPTFFIVEEMPEYKQGFYGLSQYVKKEKSKLQNKFGKKLNGKATVGFTINKKGEVSNIQILDKSNDIVAKAATKIASGMENWKPGSQRGKTVSVDFAMELEF